MKLGKLYEFVNQCVKEGMSLDTPVIAIGECGYGESLGGVVKTEMAHIDASDVIKELGPVIGINITTYLYEPEDVGCCDMWVYEDELGEFNEFE